MVLAPRWKIIADMDRTRQLLVVGVAGVALFAAVFTVLGALRPAYDPIRHFVSILSLGDGGIAQIVNFLVGGAAIVALGVGMARRWISGPGDKWIPRLVVIAGVALVGCGVFIPDPSLGYPPGTPDVLITPLTWHGAIHFLNATTIGLALSVGRAAVPASRAGARRPGARRDRGGHSGRSRGRMRPGAPGWWAGSGPARRAARADRHLCRLGLACHRRAP